MDEPKKKKSNFAQSKIIQETVSELILDHYSNYQIVEFCGKKFGIKKTQVNNYIKKANDAFKIVLKQSYEEKLASAIKRMEKLARDFKSDGRTRIAAEKELNELQKLKTLQVEVSGEVNIHSQLVDILEKMDE